MASKQTGADSTLKFLYTMLKLADVKTVDWNALAKELDISNGKAAQMRWFRFKQQMEGIPRNKPDAQRVTKSKPKGKAGKAKAKGKKGVKKEEEEEEEEEKEAEEEKEKEKEEEGEENVDEKMENGG